MGAKKDRPSTSSPVKFAEKPAVKAAEAVTVPAKTAPVATAAPVAASAAVVAAPVAAAVAKPVAVGVAAPAAAPAAPAVRDRSTIIALISRLRDQDAEVARDAAASLAGLPVDAEAVDALCAVVFNNDGYFHPVVRTAAAAALGRLGDRRAIDALIFGTRDSMAEASEEAIKALGLLADTRGREALEAVVRNDYGFFLDNVRRTAFVALANIQAANTKS